MSEREPDWPNERDLARYSELCGVDIGTFLSGGGHWIDVGPGKTARAQRALLGVAGVSLTAIGPHTRAFPPGIRFVRGSVPEDPDFLADAARTARLVTDVYGAVSYAGDPLDALLYEALLLADDGVLVAFTELERFGEADAWARVVDFFRVGLGQAAQFERVSIIGDAVPRPFVCLRVTVRGGPAGGADRLAALRDEAARRVGAARPGAVLWSSDDGLAQIRRVDYVVTP